MLIKLDRKSKFSENKSNIGRKKFYNSTYNNIELIKQELAMKQNHIMNNLSDISVGNMLNGLRLIKKGTLLNMKHTEPNEQGKHGCNHNQEPPKLYLKN